MRWNMTHVKIDSRKVNSGRDGHKDRQIISPFQFPVSNFTRGSPLAGDTGVMFVQLPRGHTPLILNQTDSFSSWPHLYICSLHPPQHPPTRNLGKKKVQVNCWANNSKCTILYKTDGSEGLSIKNTVDTCGDNSKYHHANMQMFSY